MAQTTNDLTAQINDKISSIQNMVDSRNTNENSDIRILCDTLREAVIVLYKQWHSMQFEKYNSIKTLIIERDFYKRIK